jgi:hypothetical protein
MNRQKTPGNSSANSLQPSVKASITTSNDVIHDIIVFTLDVNHQNTWAENLPSGIPQNPRPQLVKID